MTVLDNRNDDQPADTVGSLFGPLSGRDHVSVVRLRKSTLVALSWAIEDQFCARADHPVLFASFQRHSNFESARSRWEELGRLSHQTFVFADFEQTTTTETMVQVAMPADAALRREWILVCDGPELPVVLAAREVEGEGLVEEGDRLFDAIWTMDPDIVREASRISAEIALSYGAQDAQPLLYHLADHPRPGVISPAEASELFVRMVSYLDRFGA